MDPDHNHLSLSMASTLGSTSSSQQPQGQTSAPNPVAADGQENSPAPAKRGPGRPKGSTKKSLEADPSSPPKTKRPVGRPRKDGRPAGSVPKVPRGPGRPRKNFPPDFAVNTFPQQQQQQQQQHAQGDQQEWSAIQGIFSNYRLPKEATSDASASAPAPVSVNVNDSTTSNGPSATTETASNVPPTAKWYPATPAANSASASSSSIANALIHPPISNTSTGPNSLMDSLLGTSTALGRDQHMGNAGDMQVGQRRFDHGSLSIPMAQIPEYILSTVYTLFSPQAGFPLPKDVLSTYRSHLGHLAGSHAIAYNILKTFWLPYSPLLFRLVLPRTASPAKQLHRNSSSAHKPSASSSHVNNPTSHANANGENPNASRTPIPGDLTFESHRFFYWDPFYLSLSGPLTCPVCQQAPLAHCGPIRTGPLRVFDLPSSSTPSAKAHANAGLVPSVFYVIGMQYGCSQGTCGMRLNSWDPRIVNSLPQMLADEWPVHLASVPQEDVAHNESSKGMGPSGDALSRPLYALVKSLVQAGTPQEGIREVLAKLWNWSDSEKEEELDEGEEDEGEDAVENPGEGKNDKEKVAEALFASPYHRLWNAHTTQNQETESPANSSSLNGQRPPKRQKLNETVVPVGTASGPVYSSRVFGSQNPVAGGDTGGLALQVQPPPPEHRTNGTNHDNRSPRSQPQQQPQQQARPQPTQSQLKPNPSSRPPQPSPRTTITHAHAPHIHTPSPIYPSTSLPNSTTNSPQAGKGNTLSLKRPLDPETHHQPGPSAPPPPPATTQTSPAQPHFPGIVHNSPYPHLRTLQHPGRPSQPLPHPPHHHPPVPVPGRHDAPLHMHPSLAHASSVVPRFNPPTTLHAHQRMLGTTQQQSSQPPPPSQQQQQQVQAPTAPQSTPQRRVRHCVKCGRHDCKGKGGSQFCKNPCKDCGGMDCRGRNSKRPNATCREGW